MTTSNTVSGIDVSHFQGTVNWADVKAAGKVFAYAKASDGITYLDPQFNTNWSAMKAAGIIRGAYHFYESKDDPVQQANNFIKAVGAILPGDLPPGIDIETFNGNCGSMTLAGNVQVWLDTVEQALGCKPMIYTGPAFWNQYMTNQFSSYPLWIAQYGVTTPRVPNGWTSWNFWQSSENGQVNGIAGSVDLDVFAGSMQDLLAFVNPG